MLATTRTALLGAAISLVLVTATGDARADGPPRKANPSWQPRDAAEWPYQWSGLYLGASLGYGWGASTHTYDRNDDHGSAEQVLSGGLASLTVGYNLMLTPTFLAGVEGDLGFMSLTAPDKVIFDGHVWKSQFGGAWGTLRGRAGFLVDRTLVYGTAGLAFMNVDETGYGDAAGQTAWNRQTRTGWAIGAGVEHAISSRMTAKIEYLHLDLGRYEGLSENREAYSFTNSADLIRVGLNLKF